MKAELHADPSMGHKRKGSAALKKAPPKEVESHTYNWRSRENLRRAKEIS